MSLKALHICFILLSIALAAGFGLWALHHDSDSGRRVYVLLGPASLAAALGLTVYLIGFVIRMKHLKP